jgi:hypothetical protein
MKIVIDSSIESFDNSNVEIKKSASGHKDKIYFATKDKKYQTIASDKQGYSYWAERDFNGVLYRMGDLGIDYVFNIESGFEIAIDKLNKILNKYK